MIEITKKIVKSSMPIRKENSNKGDFGKLFCITGSNEYIGAGLLSALSALKVGAGYSVLCSEKDAVGYAKGKELVRGLPTKLTVKSSEMIEATKEVVGQILDAIKLTMETIQPELVADISERGILLTGGGSKIFGIDKLIEEKLGVKAKVVPNPELAVATGAGTANAYTDMQVKKLVIKED